MLPPRRSRAFPLGRFLGIPVFVDISWLIIFFLLTLVISRHFEAAFPNWLPAQHWFAGVITCLLFFVCVFLHEMGHSVVARAFGIPVLSITLFVFGGVAQIRREPSKAWHEFFIAIAGPLTSVGLGMFFFLGLCLIERRVVWDAEELSMAGSICAWLAGINVALAVFNMVPGFPLDGGRVLRSAIWAVSGRFDLATRVAAGMGTLIAYFFIAGGIYLAVIQNVVVDGIWIVCIGFFLLFAARGSVIQMTTMRAFAGLRVGDVMEGIPVRVSPAISVKTLVEGPLLHQGLRTFFVEDNGVMRGLVTMDQVKATPREEWETTPLQTIMIPAQQLVIVEPHVPLQTVTMAMEERGIDQVPVVDDNRVVGMISREGIMRVLRNRLELGTR